MKYAKFEMIIFLVLIVVILGMSAAMLVQKTDAVEVAGQALMLVVIIAGLNWGYRGGLVAFLSCLAVYAGLRLGLQGRYDLTTAALWGLIAAKFIVYGVLMLLCSHMRSQLRYFFVKLEHHDFIDDETQIGNKRFLLKELTSRINENERYEVPFSLVSFTLDEGFLEKAKGVKGANVLRDISTSILKNDTRSVDELARTGNRLVVILPCVRREGADVCCRRLEGKLRKYLEHLTVDSELERSYQVGVFEYPDDRADIESMVNALRAEIEDEKKPAGVLSSLKH